MEPIVMRGLEKRFGDRAALAGVDLSVPAGSVYGFLGPNGAGKTTTMRILLGLLRATGGEARLLGGDPWRDGPRLRAEVGFLPSDPGAYGRLTGAESLDHLSRLDRRPPVLRARACDALRLSADDLARPLRTYSRGMRQKVAIVQAVQHDPALLVLDEPTEGLDPLVQEGFFELVRERAAAGRTVFLSSHVLAEVESLCERVGIIRAGRIVAEGTIADLRRERPRRVGVLIGAGPDPALPGARLVGRRDGRLLYDHRGETGPLLRALAELAPLDVSIEEPGLDEVFLDLYRGDGAA
jgi:ABC-2 type transport system ATP-binding protein